MYMLRKKHFFSIQFYLHFYYLTQKCANHCEQNQQKQTPTGYGVCYDPISPHVIGYKSPMFSVKTKFCCGQEGMPLSKHWAVKEKKNGTLSLTQWESALLIDCKASPLRVNAYEHEPSQPLVSQFSVDALTCFNFFANSNELGMFSKNKTFCNVCILYFSLLQNRIIRGPEKQCWGKFVGCKKFYQNTQKCICFQV